MESQKDMNMYFIKFWNEINSGSEDGETDCPNALLRTEMKQFDSI